MIRLAINGFGRIGRAALKIALANPAFEIAAINDLATPAVLAHLLKYDSVYGTYEKEVETVNGDKKVEIEGELTEESHFTLPESPAENYLSVAGQKIRLLAEKDPLNLPWKKLAVDVVLECTGRFTEVTAAEAHLKAGAKRVVISAPLKGDGPTYLLGVNAEEYKGEKIISNASCTTNCISPVAAVIEREFGIIKASMTTIHAYTAEQNLVDGVPPALHKDLRRGRAAGVNIVPTTTGAAKAVAGVIPELRDHFDGLAIRVPVVCGSLSDFTILVKRKVTKEEVNKAFLQAVKSPKNKGVLATACEPLVSTDIVKNPHSAVVDLTLTKVIDGDLVKIVAWYDNEWGYASRLVELAAFVTSFQ